MSNPDARIGEIAVRHGFSKEAALTLLESLARGYGSQAQFDHPELGGLGQWSSGGMIMIGDMFNETLKSRVAALANELAQGLSRGELEPDQRTDTRAWPADLGTPSTSGSQNSMRYAVFPATRRLAIEATAARRSTTPGTIGSAACRSSKAPTDPWRSQASVAR